MVGVAKKCVLWLVAVQLFAGKGLTIAKPPSGFGHRTLLLIKSCQAWRLCGGQRGGRCYCASGCNFVCLWTPHSLFGVPVGVVVAPR